ncbi:hypothetical protein [Chlamydia serpentis]|nr:hypothetical protein [Chlamydia serpentis]
MSSKRTSKIAVLSILLIFTHSTGLANTNPPIGLSTIYVNSKTVDKLQNKKEIKKQRKEQRQLEKKDSQRVTSKKSFFPYLKTLTARSERFKKPSSEIVFESKSQVTSRSQRFKRLKECSIKTQDIVIENNDSKEFQVVSKRSLSFPNLKLKNLSPKFPQKEKKDKGASSLASLRKRYSTQSSASPLIFLETEIVQAPVENPHSQQEDSKKSKQLASKDLVAKSERIDHSLRELAQGASLPVLVRPNPELLVQRQKEVILKELIAEHRQCKRKSAREALESRCTTKQVPRDASVTSTLRYNPEKAAEIKSRRNCKVRREAREQKNSSCKREAHVSNKQTGGTSNAEEKETVKGSRSEKTKTGSQLAKYSPNFYSNAGNTNIGTYLTANQYSCDSEETDWPCSSCVSKRRTHNSISVCTMVVTVIAMIVGALIIANATESPTKPSPTPTPNPSPTP